MRLALSQVEDALRDPAAWARRLAEDKGDPRTYSRSNALRHAIGYYHSLGADGPYAREYLEAQLSEKFKEGRKSEETRDQLDWYIDHWEGLERGGWLCADLRVNVTVPSPPWVRDDFRCSGQVLRFDIVPDGGYAAWIVTQEGAPERLGGIEPLLLQYAVADHLSIPLSEVVVGIYGFRDRFVGTTSGDDAAVLEARDEFFELLARLDLKEK
ncbi:hypothetical protein [Rubricoccus marinus]|uniref:hypothetical protein n=1 Tax=Rubricoccus marinus TaxID=716817 RepID=UPI00117B1BF5|nr:hypothetical protein [Rubricoccus marinus]